MWQSRGLCTPAKRQVSGLVNTELDQFRLATYRFTLRPREEMILPVYKGAVLRGGFGQGR